MFPVLFCAVSCGPDVFSMLIEMRYPSSSGMDLGGKSMSVVYLEDSSSKKDSSFSASLAEGFAKELERDYFDGEEAVGIFRMDKTEDGVYSSRDTLVSAAMQTGSDVVFLFDAPSFGEVSVAEDNDGRASSAGRIAVTAPFRLNLYVYNTLGADSVRVFRGSSSVSKSYAAEYLESRDTAALKDVFFSSLSDAGKNAGESASSSFLSNWEPEVYYFYYYDSPSAWDAASKAAYEYRWHDAVDNWMKVLDGNDMYRRSAAEFNIAEAFYLLGDYELAAEWLNQSDKDSRMEQSPTLSRRIEARKNTGR